jgi:hypothetical protein
VPQDRVLPRQGDRHLPVTGPAQEAQQHADTGRGRDPGLGVGFLARGLGGDHGFVDAAHGEALDFDGDVTVGRQHVDVGHDRVRTARAPADVAVREPRYRSVHHDRLVREGRVRRLVVGVARQ